MVCAAGRDYRSAMLLLGDTLQHYRQQQQGHPLAHEAELGLAMARWDQLLLISTYLTTLERTERCVSPRLEMYAAWCL
jgi:hypothetical protein